MYVSQNMYVARHVSCNPVASVGLPYSAHRQSTKRKEWPPSGGRVRRTRGSELPTAGLHRSGARETVAGSRAGRRVKARAPTVRAR